MHPPHLSDLLLLQVVPLNHDSALKGAAVPVVENPLLGQEVGLLFGLGMLHVLLVLGQTLLLLLLGCAMVLVHLLRQGQSRGIMRGDCFDKYRTEFVQGCSQLLVNLSCNH